MIKIGELARLTDVSIQTIRFYESMGLLSPVMVDRWTNYRYYDERSVERLSEINYLKELGFSLKEIKNFNQSQIDEKIEKIKADIKKLTKQVCHLTAIRQKAGELIMKNFVNDDRVVGKWEKIGVVQQKSDFHQQKFMDEKIFDFPEIYFLPRGQEYWAFSWSKGVIYLTTDKESRVLPYEIEDDVMFVGVPDVISDSVDCFAVYKKVDSKEYSPELIRISDNTKLPFIDDETLIGFWKAVDFIRVGDVFDANKKEFPDDLFLKKFDIEPNGSLVVEYKDGVIGKLNWTKGVILNHNNKTASEYRFEKHNNKDYLIMEWKSGDYFFGGKVRGYYVFEKQK